MMEWLTEKLMTWCERRGRVFKITGTSGPDDVYLIRYYVFQSRWMNIFIHQFLRSDRDDLHDHPWDFFTYLVRGAYVEKKYNEKTGQIDSIERVNCDTFDRFATQNIIREKHNTFVLRKATDAHQVVVPIDLKEWQKKMAALTICVTGPTRREWGFWKNDKDGGRFWVNWKKYLGLPEDAPSRG